MKKRLNRIAPLLVLPLLVHAAWANAESCDETLRKVEKLYNNTVDSCGQDPASDCSGLLVRGTHRADPAKGKSGTSGTPARKPWSWARLPPRSCAPTASVMKTLA